MTATGMYAKNINQNK